MTTPVIYQFVNHELQSSPGGGQVIGDGLNLGLRNSTTTSVPGLLESIDSSVKSVVKGAEAGHGAGAGGVAGSVGWAAGAVAKIDDVTAVGNNLLAGKHLEAGMELAGAFGGAAGGSAAGYLAAASAEAIGLVPAWRVAAVGASIFLGDQTAGDLGKTLVYNEWIQANAPIIAPDAALQPAATLNGINYYVVSSPDANGTPRTFVYTDSIAASGGDPLLMSNQSRYVPVVNQDISRQVVNGVLTELGYDPNISLGQWNVMQGASASGYALNGTYYENSGTATVAGVGSSAETRQPAVQVTTWRDATTGAIMEARVSGQRVDGQFQADTAGVFASGMDTAGRMVLTGQAAQSVADYQMRPAASTAPDSAMPEGPTLAPVAVEGVNGLDTYTTVSIQTHANGAASFDFVGEDGSRAWVVHNAESGNRTVVINSGQDVQGEPRTVVYELDRNGRRVGQERDFDAVGTPVNGQGEMQASQVAPAAPTAPALAPAPAQAPAQQEPIPRIVTHEQRVTPTPGGMSFAEAHKRRDEPEQISAGSLQPVGKLDEIHRAKGSPLYRVHQAHEQALMRDLGIAQAQDWERFKNEPAPGRQQPSVERTQERTQEQAPRRLLEEPPVQKQAEARQAAPSIPAVQAPAPTREEPVAAAPVIHTPAPAHAHAAPQVPLRPAAAAEAMHSPITHASMASPLHANAQGAAVEQRAAAPPPSQAVAQPAAAAIAAAHAETAAAQAELAEMRERVARMEEQRRQDGLERRDERDRSNRREETTQLAQSRDTRQRLDAAAHDKQISATAVADTSGPLLRDFSDPSHPQNTLYNTIKEALPADTSPRWLAQATATCYMSNIKTPDDLGNIHGINGTVVFMSNSLFSRNAFLEATQPLTTIQQTMQQVQQFDQQRAQMMSDIRAQNAAQANQQQGPTLGGP